MQIFIVGTVIETAKILDKKRFHRQITEAELIYKGILGENGWGDNIVAKMYKNHIDFLKLYIEVFKAVKRHDYLEAEILSKKAEICKPSFICDAYIRNMKSRLYTKDPIYYTLWKDYGESHINIYYINNEWRSYKQK